MISNKKLFLLSTPLIIYVCVYVFYPTISVVVSSFTGGENLFSNYSEVLTDAEYIMSLKNALIYGIGIALGGISLSICLAILMYSLTSKRIATVVQLSTYTPHLMSWVVIFGVWNVIFQPTGLINALLYSFGVIEVPIQFWASDNFSRFAIIIMTIWKDVGYNALLFYVALLSIPSSLLEAVSLEDDTFWNKAKTVYIPHLSGTIVTLFMLIFVGALMTFDSAYIVMNSVTKDAVQTPAVWAYEQGVVKGNENLADAASCIFMVICIIIIIIIRKVTSKYEKYTG